ncbi:MAG: carboxymuconolactone decarboxylase family protein [Firmicutes bacterium]|nr:carboxymuconolactone decarboxylase family protein [Bacillota bacterium]
MNTDPNPALAESQITEVTAELIALAAAMASSNHEAFQVHTYRLNKLGVTREDMIKAVNIALQIKMAPHRTVVEMAEHYLVGGEKNHGCCGGDCECDEEAGGGCGEGGCGCH